MARNKGQFTSAKMNDGAYNSGTDQDSAQDDSRPEILCVCLCHLTAFAFSCFKSFLALTLKCERVLHVGVLIAALVPVVHQ